jgi:putative endonuclease
MAGGFIYLLTNRPNGILYVGVTNDLVRRIFEHRSGFVEGFTKRYSLKRLVYFEKFESIQHQTLVPSVEGSAYSRRQSKLGRSL